MLPVMASYLSLVFKVHQEEFELWNLNFTFLEQTGFW